MKMDPRIRNELEATGLPWELQQAQGHLKLRVAGRLVGVMSTRPCPNPRASKNTVTQIRRMAANIKGEAQ